MLGLPKTTEIAKQLPKKAIYSKFELKPALRDHFDADISRIDALILFVGLIIFLLYTLHMAKKGQAEVTEEVQEQIDPQKLPEPQKQAEPQKQVEPQKQPEAKSPEMLESEKYDAMDPRVRLGAYRIIGLSRVEKAKEGDDLRRIAKRVLGPDMECYLEVYNNMKASTPLKAGQDIKIPKLQWKKKKTVQK